MSGSRHVAYAAGIAAGMRNCEFAYYAKSRPGIESAMSLGLVHSTGN